MASHHAGSKMWSTPQSLWSLYNLPGPPHLPHLDPDPQSFPEPAWSCLDLPSFPSVSKSPTIPIFFPTFTLHSGPSPNVNSRNKISLSLFWNTSHTLTQSLSTHSFYFFSVIIGNWQGIIYSAWQLLVPYRLLLGPIDYGPLGRNFLCLICGCVPSS